MKIINLKGNTTNFKRVLANAKTSRKKSDRINIKFRAILFQLPFEAKEDTLISWKSYDKKEHFLKIKKGTVIGRNTVIGSQVTIGEDCIISNNVKIAPKTRIDDLVRISKFALIGYNCYVGVNVYIQNRAIVEDLKNIDYYKEVGAHRSGEAISPRKVNRRKNRDKKAVSLVRQ